jgi:hypothetical protein
LTGLPPTSGRWLNTSRRDRNGSLNFRTTFSFLRLIKSEIPARHSEMRDIPHRWGVAHAVREALAALYDAVVGNM